MLLNLSLDVCFDVLDLTVDERTHHPLVQFEKLLGDLKLEYIQFDLTTLTILSMSIFSKLATKADIEKCRDYLKHNRTKLSSLAVLS